MKQIVFSGIQPSGQLHIGNYFGAIYSWLKLQESKDNDCIFAIVDYHALTEGPDPQELQQRIFDTAVDFLAAGLDPDKSIIMLQSLVPEHTDLAWILNCVTPVSWLERVPTYKDKTQQFSNNLNMGLLDYPVLMAADILMYKTNLVPVGLDQLPHLELAREIARAFNTKYGKTLTEPKAKITPTPKIMSLTDPTKKMSKSLGSKSYIALADSPATIEKKVKSMPTATGNEKDVIKEFLKNTQEVNKEFKDLAQSFPPDQEIHTESDLMKVKDRLGNSKYKTFMGLFNLYMLLYIFADKKDRQKYLKDLQNGTVKFSETKKLLTDKIVNFPELVSFRKKRDQLIKNPTRIATILKQGSQKARRRAQKNLTAVKKKVGLS
ncbi:tryptophan--tRNA ligase [Patescibacteria group bacterium]|nr:tryptophan--tRNA ligase [Patescibacteria group bacterium]